MTKVLIVDDEASIRITLSEFLIREGYDTDTAADVLEAFNRIANEDYDVIVTDIVMPKISGMELLANIRKKSDKTQVIVMTGEPTVDTAIQAVQSGASDYLSKPINKQNLLKAVGHAGHIKSLQDEKLALEKENRLYQKNLEGQVNERTEALRSAMQSIVYLLSSVVETRDPYTAGHQRRVGNLAAAIATKMKLDTRTADYLRVIGYIHDIGKIVIPTEILAKPGKLSNLEMEMIRTHSLRGYEMLERVDLPAIIEDTVLAHHERCDGSGYPNGLIAEEISGETHILIVADVVEAMMSHRPYRPMLGLEAALSEIQQNAGRLYQSEVVDACVSLFRQDHYEIDDTEHEISFLF